MSNKTKGELLERLRQKHAKKKEVIVTVDGGIEDLEYFAHRGRKELRGMVLLRVIDEGLEQGVVFSEEDLGKLLATSVRTIKRDVPVLRAEGCNDSARAAARVPSSPFRV